MLIRNCFSVDHIANFNLVNISKVDMSVEVNIYLKRKLIEVENLLDVTRVEETQHKKPLISVVLNILAC